MVLVALSHSSALDPGSENATNARTIPSRLKQNCRDWFHFRNFILRFGRMHPIFAS